MPATLIRRLPTLLANKIAAGEVVERPASVLKELVENALDAGVTRLSIALQAGGRRLVRVTDDGCGMSPDDAILCIERHATSKIAADSDLERLSTFGFRGEALPSIAAVSKFELTTRTADAIAGTRVLVEGGTIRDVSDIGAPPGTTVSVRHLFFNMPARAKFLKSRETELSHCLTVAQHAAVAHPGIALTLDHNGRLALDVPAADESLARIGQLWGAQMAEQLRPVAGAGVGFQLSGYIAGPEITRANRSLQLIFINGRPVSNATIAHAISEAYRGRLMVGRYPVAFLFFTMDPTLVDVNVHPTKREVRFRRSEPVHEAVLAAIRDAFGALGTYTPTPPTPGVAPPPYESRPATALPSPDFRVEPTFNLRAVTPAPAPGAVWPPPPESAAPAPCALGTPGGPLPAPRSTLGPPLELDAQFAADIPPYTFLHQIFQTYLLCTYEDQLVVIDQHALHERIVYEQLVERVDRADWNPQRLLLPRVLEFAPDRAAVLGEHLTLFRNLGLEIEPFGEHTFAVTAVSPLHSDSYLEQLVRDGVEELRQGKALRAPRELMDRLLTMSACKNAIKAGQNLAATEVQVLLDGLRGLPRPPTCLHGRPLVLAITKGELDRRFGRLGTVH